MISGCSSGSVIVRKSCQRVAPSTSAASYWSSGRVRSPAARMIATNGVHCQTSASRIELSATERSPSHTGPLIPI